MDDFGQMNTGRINMDIDSLAGDTPLIVLADSHYQQVDLTEVLVKLTGQPFHTSVPKPPIWHWNGVPYYAADAPPRKHVHWPQTVIHFGVEMWQCPCRAVGGPYEAPWHWPPIYKPRYARPWWRFW